MYLRFGLAAGARRVSPSGSRANIIFILPSFLARETAATVIDFRAQVMPLSWFNEKWFLPLDCCWQWPPWGAVGLGYQPRYMISPCQCSRAFSWMRGDLRVSSSDVSSLVLGLRTASARVSVSVYLRAVCFEARYARLHSCLERCFALICQIFLGLEVLK